MKTQSTASRGRREGLVLIEEGYDGVVAATLQLHRCLPSGNDMVKYYGEVFKGPCVSEACCLIILWVILLLMGVPQLSGLQIASTF